MEDLHLKFHLFAYVMCFLKNYLFTVFFTFFFKAKLIQSLFFLLEVIINRSNVFKKTIYFILDFNFLNQVQSFFFLKFLFLFWELFFSRHQFWRSIITYFSFEISVWCSFNGKVSLHKTLTFQLLPKFPQLFFHHTPHFSASFTIFFFYFKIWISKWTFWT